jgi:hypothetical protein
LRVGFYHAALNPSTDPWFERRLFI